MSGLGEKIGKALRAKLRRIWWTWDDSSIVFWKAVGWCWTLLFIGVCGAYVFSDFPKVAFVFWLMQVPMHAIGWVVYQIINIICGLFGWENPIPCGYINLTVGIIMLGMLIGFRGKD